MSSIMKTTTAAKVADKLSAQLSQPRIFTVAELVKIFATNLSDNGKALLAQKVVKYDPEGALEAYYATTSVSWTEPVLTDEMTPHEFAIAVLLSSEVGRRTFQSVITTYGPLD